MSEWLKENLAGLIVKEWPQVDFCLEALSRACILADDELIQPPAVGLRDDKLRMQSTHIA